MGLVFAISGAWLAFSPFSKLISPATPTSVHQLGRASLLARSRSHIVAFEEQAQQRAIMHPRCRIVAFDDDAVSLSDEQIVALFREFDTSGDGFIQLEELEAALAKAGKPVSKEAAQEILERADVDKDGQISLAEFRSVFQLSPGAVPDTLRALTGVSGFFLNGLSRFGDALGIEVSGQWRTTEYGSKYVDDVVGSGSLAVPGDIVQLQYTVTLLSNDKVVETTRGGPALGFQLGEVSDTSGAVQGWNDAVSGMRVGGQRRVYAEPREGDGPTARYDIEVVGVEESAPRSTQEKLITSLGGRRAAFRLLFALSFVPYFLPNDLKPAFFRDDWGAPDPAERLSAQEARQEAKVDKADGYVASQLDALFAQEERPMMGAKAPSKK